MPLGDKSSGFFIDQAKNRIASRANSGNTQIAINDFWLPSNTIVTNIDNQQKKSISNPSGRRIGITEIYAIDGLSGSTGQQGERYFEIRGELIAHPSKKNELGLSVMDEDAYEIHEQMVALETAVTEKGSAVPVLGKVFSTRGIKYVTVLGFKSGEEAGFFNAAGFSIECKEEDVDSTVFGKPIPIAAMKQANKQTKKKLKKKTASAPVKSTGFTTQFNLGSKTTVEILR